MTERLGVTLSEDDRADLELYLDTYRNWSGETVLEAFDGSNETHREERLRGLLYILGQHPTFTFR